MSTPFFCPAERNEYLPTLEAISGSVIGLQDQTVRSAIANDHLIPANNRSVTAPLICSCFSYLSCKSEKL